MYFFQGFEANSLNKIGKIRFILSGGADVSLIKNQARILAKKLVRSLKLDSTVAFMENNTEFEEWAAEPSKTPSPAEFSFFIIIRSIRHICR